MKIAILLSVAILAGCQTSPSLPERIERPVPWDLLADCPDMQDLKDASEDAKIDWIADMADKYPKCAERFPMLREWFKAGERK